MKANELRKFNLVQITSEKAKEEIEEPSPWVNEFEVKAIRDDGIDSVEIYNEIENVYCYASMDEIEPIPLTEEWLLKFGFEKLNLIAWRCGNIIIETVLGFNVRMMATEESSVFIKKIKHVHQLQNLYFALTNEELTIKKIKL